MDHPIPFRPEDHAVYDPEKMGKSTLFQSDRLLVGLNAFEPGQEHRLHAHARDGQGVPRARRPRRLPPPRGRGTARSADGGGHDADRAGGGPARHPQHRGRAPPRPGASRALSPDGAMSLFARALCLLLLLGAPAAAQPVKVVAAGDISCDPADPSYSGGNGTATACRMKATSDLALALAPDAVLLLGDNQYENGYPGQVPGLLRPKLGAPQGDHLSGPRQPRVPHRRGGRLLHLLRSRGGGSGPGLVQLRPGGMAHHRPQLELRAVGGCGPASPQGQWLAADLAAHPGVCTLAYWHHPRFSSGPHGNDAISAPFWDALYAAGADLVLVGHDHGYERFAPQTPAGAADPAKGIRQIVVGTGGKNLTGIVTVRANSEVRALRHLRRARADAPPERLRVEIRACWRRRLH